LSNLAFARPVRVSVRVSLAVKGYRLLRPRPVMVVVAKHCRKVRGIVGAL
jgi:hypothetical protein